MSGRASVLVLGGGPDAEREVSLRSSAAVADALRTAGHEVRLEVIDRVSPEALAGLAGDVVFPVLHGRYGEGGDLQRTLEASGRCFVGCREAAARLCMDKIAAKLACAAAGVPTAPAGVLDPDAERPTIGLPCVVKPVHEGSSVGLHLCRDEAAWRSFRERAGAGTARDGVMLVERLIEGRELTVGVLEPSAGVHEPLPIVEIRPADGAYDYDAKYRRTDTRYIVGPELDADADRSAVLALRLHELAMLAARATGVRHLARVDFMLDASGVPWLLEINTMPGFTATSLLPMAAAAQGLAMPELCSLLVQAAARSDS